jgi:hypothetical protein
LRRYVLALFLLALVVPGTAYADNALPGAERDPVVFLDEPGSAVWLVSHGNEGYAFFAFVRVSGFSSKTDRLRIDWKQGAKLLASVKCDLDTDLTSKQASGRCRYDDKGIKAKGAIDGELIYSDDQNGKEYLVRTFKVTVKTWHEIGNSALWQIMPDDLLGTAWVRHWYAEGSSSLYHRPQFIFWAATTNHNVRGSLRCTVAGKKLPDFDAGFETVDQAEQVDADHTAPNGSKQHYRWEHIKLVPDVFFGQRQDLKNMDPTKLRFLVDNPGAWDCEVRVDGKAIRQLLFTVNDKGLIQKDDLQNGKRPIPSLPNVVLVDVRIPKGSDFDIRVRPDAMKKSMGFGLPWPDHPKVKEIQSAFPSASGLPDPQ